jgi:hypothetical protein
MMHSFLISTTLLVLVVVALAGCIVEPIGYDGGHGNGGGYYHQHPPEWRGGP